VYLFDVDPEIQSFRKTLKSFDKLNAKIKKKAAPSQTGKGLRRAALIVCGVLLIISILIPPFRFPVEGKISSGVFLRKRPESYFALDLEAHNGVDLAAPPGTPVVSSAAGVVVETGSSDTYGRYVRVRHLFGLETRYAHLSEIDTKEGALIILRTLQPVGKVGSTGRATGPHLHFEVRWLKAALPPRFFLLFHGLRKAVLGF